MDNMLCCIDLQSPYWNLVNFFLAFFAALIAIGYFARPRLHYAPLIQNGKWKAKVINKNLLFTVKEIKCEIAVSECRSFETAYSLNLQKDTTLMLRKYHHGINNYVFSPRNLINTIHLRLADRPMINNQRPEYRYLRIRLLAPNFLGVKKHFEHVFTIAEITENCILRSQCYYNRH